MHPAAPVVYQIFPERFAIGRAHTSATKLAQPAYQQAGNRCKQWHELPVTNEAERAVQGQIFYGGDLDGVIDQLDYLQGLGVTTLYFTPIFAAPSNHKYDAVDYFRIDPMFGDEATLRRLISALKQRGMGLILDAVLNHVSNTHPWFLAAQRGERPYRDWFSFDEDGGYQCWQGFTSLAELRLEEPSLQEVLYRGQQSFLAYYLEMGIAGWRFDTAQDVGLPTAQAIRAAILPRYPNAQLLGELMGYAGGWLDGSGYTGMMNYYFRNALLAWLAGQIDHRQANLAMADYYRGYGHAGALASWLMLSSHDTPRLAHTLPSLALRRLAFTAQFTLPGIPLVYYGEENGMQGAGDPDCRRPMVWDEAQWDQSLRAYVRQLTALRQQLPALHSGRLITVGERLQHNALIYIRHTDEPGETALVVINLGDAPLQGRVFLPCPHLYDGVPLQDRLNAGAAPIKTEGGSVVLDVAPGTAALYTPFEPLPNYRFFKPRNCL